jgi:hypothetical protein
VEFSDGSHFKVFTERLISRVKLSSLQLLRLYSGKCGLRPRTLVALWKSLIRPKLEYAMAIWAPRATKATWDKVEAIQNEFCRRVLKCGKLPNEVVTSELGLVRLRHRADEQILMLWGKLFCMQPSRLVAQVFRRRLEDICAGSGELSWCAEALETLQIHKLGTSVGDLKQWKLSVKRAVAEKAMYDLASCEERRSTRSYTSLQPEIKFADYLDRTDHPEAQRLMLQLRAGTLELHDRLGDIGDWPRASRLCPMCGAEPEDRAHFLLRCSKYSRHRVKLRMTIKIRLHEQHAATAFNLLLADKLFDQTESDESRVAILLGASQHYGFPPQVAAVINGAALNFAVAIWRQRTAAGCDRFRVVYAGPTGRSVVLRGDPTDF